MGDHLIAVALPERRKLSAGVIEKFNSLNIGAVPDAYQPILDILQTYFSVRDALPLDEMTPDQRHRVIEAILRRIQGEREGLERRQIAGTESLATNAFLLNRLYYLKEVVAALLGHGITPEEVDGMIIRGESIVCRSMAGLEIRRPTGISSAFSALQYILTGASGETEWTRLTDVSNVSLSAITCGFKDPLLNLYWALVLRGDIRKPSDIRKIPTIQALFAPIMEQVRLQMESAEPNIQAVYQLVTEGQRGKRNVYTLDNALRLYTQNPTNLSALLQYLRATTQSDADAAAGTRMGSLDICHICGSTAATTPTITPPFRRLAAAYVVALELQKMLAT
jgi:hypothetical protein